MDLSLIVNQFNIPGRLICVNPTGSGNVNDTFLAIFRNTFDEKQVILQRINKNVFIKPEQIMHNLRTVTEHVHAKLENEVDYSDRVWQMPKIIHTRSGKDFLTDDDGHVWRVITKISSATAFDEPQGVEHAAECGAVLGHFHLTIADLDPGLMQDPLPGFHITPKYLAAYDALLKNEPKAHERLNSSMEAKRLGMFIEQRRAFAYTLQNALDAQALTMRLMHGDPKVNNIMIDDVTGKGTAMIDLDTVSPGLVQYDFGDALRSLCNRAGEEEPDLKNVVFDLDLCAAFCKGYMATAGSFLTPADRHYLYDAIRLIAFELGLRFFRDHLAGNVYFKVRHAEQNLNRARVQFKLCESIEARENMIRALLENP